MRATVRRILLVLVALAPLAPPAAAGCPFCDGGPSGVNQVRAAIFDAHFWPRVAATVAPFPVLAGVVALVYFFPTRPAGDRRRPR